MTDDINELFNEYGTALHGPRCSWHRRALFQSVPGDLRQGSDPSERPGSGTRALSEDDGRVSCRRCGTTYQPLLQEEGWHFLSYTIHEFTSSMAATEIRDDLSPRGQGDDLVLSVSMTRRTTMFRAMSSARHLLPALAADRDTLTVTPRRELGKCAPA